MSLIDRIKSLLRIREERATTPYGGQEMISCADAVKTIYEYLDGELDDVSHEQVKAHFDVCSRCYPHLRLEESFRSAVQRATAGDGAPPELKNRLMEALSEADQG